MGYNLCYCTAKVVQTGTKIVIIWYYQIGRIQIYSCILIIRANCDGSLEFGSRHAVLMDGPASQAPLSLRRQLTQTVNLRATTTCKASNTHLAATQHRPVFVRKHLRSPEFETSPCVADALDVRSKAQGDGRFIATTRLLTPALLYGQSLTHSPSLLPTSFDRPVRAHSPDPQREFVRDTSSFHDPNFRDVTVIQHLG